MQEFAEEYEALKSNAKYADDADEGDLWMKFMEIADECWNDSVSDFDTIY